MSTTIKGKNIDTSKIAFSQPRVLDNGAKLVYMNYDGGRLSVQSPWMSLPWKMGVYTEGEYPKYSLDISFKGMENDPELQQFHDKLQGIEGKIIDGGFDNSVSWFKKRLSSREFAEQLFNPILKVSKDKDTGEPDGKWPPTMKLKISRKNGQWESGKDKSGREKPLIVKNQDGHVYNINSEDNLEDLFVKNTRVRVKMSCVGLWVASGNYMCQWQLTHAEVDIKDEDDDDNFLPSSDDEGEEPSGGGGVVVEDSGDEEEGGGDGGGEDGEDGGGEDGGGGGEDGGGEDGGGEDGGGEPEPEPEPEKKQVKIKRKIVKKKVSGN
jgi:hypothetical protein